MDCEIEDNIVVAKLDHETSIFKSMEKILKDLDRESALIVSGIGMLKDFKLGFYNSEKGEYQWESFDEPMELVTLGGSISDEGTIHLHASVSGKDHVLSGGHLEGGEVFNVVELVMLVFNGMVLSREYDEERKMRLLSMG